MLVLTRGANESIVIPRHRIRITILKHDRHGRLVIGIEAPDDVGVWRQEVYEKMERGERLEMTPVPALEDANNG